MCRAIVIGAGMSGLAAAHRLRRAGWRVRVLERSTQPGGYAQTKREGGYVTDIGPDALTSGYDRYLALIDDYGLGDQVVPSSGVVGVVRRGRVIDLDPKHPVALAGSGVLSRRAKLNLVRGFVATRREVTQVDPYRLIDHTELDDPSDNALAYAARHFGNEAAEALIEPILRVTTGAAGWRASVSAVHNALAGWTSGLVNIRGGLDRLPRAMAARMDVRYGVEVTAVAEHDGGVTVRTDGGETFDADACVLAVMYEPACAIWPVLLAAAPGFRADLEYCKLVSVSIGFAAPTRTKSYMTLVPTREQRDFQLLFVQQNKAPDRVPPGHSLVTTYTDSDATDRYLAMSDEEVASETTRMIESFCPELRGQRDYSSVERFPRTAYLPTPGYWHRAAALRRALPIGGVQLAGTLFGAGGMEVAIRWGERAADRIIRRHHTSSASPAFAAET